MKAFQFIKNDIGEVVNVDKITAVTFDEFQAPYKMRVYTPMTKFGITFHYDIPAKLWNARRNLDKMLNITRLRIIKFANWWLIADAVESISDCADGIRVRMIDGQNFDIVIKNREEVEAMKKEIENSLANMWSLTDLNSGYEED